MEKVKIKKLIEHWSTTSERSHKIADFLYKNKRYSESLFFCHLMIEKILKALFVQKNKTHAPFIHELDVLAQRTKLNLNSEQMKNLKIITTFNIAARYDDIKNSFYKKCTKEYTDEYFNISKKIYLWLKKQQKK